MQRLLKRWWFWVLITLPLIVVAGLPLLSKDALRARFETIKVGMTTDQVVGIIGSQPTRTVQGVGFGQYVWDFEDALDTGCDGFVLVFFDDKWRVTSTVLSDPPMVDRLWIWVSMHLARVARCWRS
jgi:hypothetical protein